MVFNLTYTLVAATVLYAVLHSFLRIWQDAREPPVVLSGIPFISPVIDMVRKKARFFVHLRDQYGLPIYTLRLPGFRMYIVNSTTLLASVQRQTKVLSFEALKVRAAINVAGSSQKANDVINSERFGGKNSGGYAASFHKRLHAELSPQGDALHAMNRSVLTNVTKSLENINAQKPPQTSLFEWIKHEVGMITTDAVYGPYNPFRHPEVEQSFWTFESGIMIMLLGLSSFATKTHRARETLVSAFAHYFSHDHHTQGAGITRARFEFNAQNNIPVPDIARFELGGAIALLTNIVPTCFWMLYHVYSDPQILRSCRDEIANVTHESLTSDGQKQRTIDVEGIESQCPTLLATMREVLRYRTVGTSARLVMEDHMLDNKYLLKKGGMVMLPGPVQHSDTTAWGANAADFDHTRFLQPDKRVPAAAFRAFGGGASLCPGRHFATTIILNFTAMLVMQSDIVPVTGVWPSITTEKAGGWEVTPKPDQDVTARIDARKGENEKCAWAFSPARTRRAVQVTVEDVGEHDL